MAHPLALVLAAALASAATFSSTSPRALLGHAAYGGAVDGEWNGWTNVRQALLEKGYATQAFRRGGRHLVTLERRYPEAGPQGALTVVAAIEFPVPRGHELSEQGYCEVKGESATPLLFAVVRSARAREEYHPSVRAAWRIDLEGERIVPVDPKTVRCGNAAFGF
jgi:hypothetical protein